MSLSQRIGNLILTATYPFLYFGEWTKDKVIYNIDGCIFKLRVWTSDKTVVWEVFKNKIYTDDENFKINSSDIILDIGGNIGAFSVFAARNAKKVYVYEALKENYDLLNENLKLNKLNNVKSFNLAVSDKVGKEEFFIEKGNIGGSSFYKKSYSIRKVKVFTTTLKKIFFDNHLKKINFLKMDVEGAEYKILLNASPALLKKIDKIVLEFHDNLSYGHNYNDLKELLENNGFDVCVSIIPFLGKIFKTGIIKAKSKFIN